MFGESLQNSSMPCCPSIWICAADYSLILSLGIIMSVNTTIMLINMYNKCYSKLSVLNEIVGLGKIARVIILLTQSQYLYQL